MKNFSRFLAQHFVWHLSGWVGNRYGAMARVLFAPELDTWVSGREIRKSQKNTVPSMKFSIVENDSTSGAIILTGLHLNAVRAVRCSCSVFGVRKV